MVFNHLGNKIFSVRTAAKATWWVVQHSPHVMYMYIHIKLELQCVLLLCCLWKWGLGSLTGCCIWRMPTHLSMSLFSTSSHLSRPTMIFGFHLGLYTSCMEKGLMWKTWADNEVFREPWRGDEYRRENHKCRMRVLGGGLLLIYFGLVPVTVPSPELLPAKFFLNEQLQTPCIKHQSITHSIRCLNVHMN